MRLPSWRRLALPLGLLLAGGCGFPLCGDTDRRVCEAAALPIDVRLGSAEESSPPVQEPPPAQPGIQGRLRVPAELPGSTVPPIRLPPLEPEFNEERKQTILRLYPPLPPLGANPAPAPNPEGRPLELADLQRLALSNNPAVRQASADVDAAHGAAIQAGVYPNPSLGLTIDDVGLGNTAGKHTAFLQQTIKTGGKLKFARAAAEMDVRNAETAFRRAQYDVMGQVRANYFAVLSAREGMRVGLAFAHFTEEIYHIQVDLLSGAQVAAYEPLQFRALAVQARGTLIQARNRYAAAWKQLAASLGLPGMPPAELAGRVDMPLPLYKYEDVLARVLSRHTDLLTAENGLARARYNLRLQQVTPVPDVTVKAGVNRDYTQAPNNTTAVAEIDIPLPVWDRNQGNIRQADAQLLRASEEAHRVRADLSSRLAEAFERYQTNRQLLAFYRDQILPDQVRVFRNVFERYSIQETKKQEIQFIDISTAQQNLGTSLTAYLTALGAQWTAVVDVANLLQTEDLFQVGGERVGAECLAPLPDLGKLLELPCQHPCSPPVDPALRGGGDPRWPDALPARDAAPQPTGAK